MTSKTDWTLVQREEFPAGVCGCCGGPASTPEDTSCLTCWEEYEKMTLASEESEEE